MCNRYIIYSHLVIVKINNSMILPYNKLFYNISASDDPVLVDTVYDYFSQNLPASYQWYDARSFFTAPAGYVEEVSIPDDVTPNVLTLIDVSEPVVNIEEVEQMLVAAGFEYFILLHTNYEVANTSRLLFFPTDLIIRSISYKYDAIENNLPANNPARPDNRRYSLSCLNRRPTEFRILNHYYMTKTGYWDKNKCYTSITSEAVEYDPGSGDLNMYGFEPHEVAFYRSIPRTKIPKDVSTVSSAFQDAYLNYCIETDQVVPFFSEKTAKPIASAQFFFVVSGGSPMAKLKAMGFDIFDDIFDHTVYDDGSMNDKNRIFAIHDLINTHFADLADIYAANKSRVLDNQTYFYSEEFKQPYFVELKEAASDLAFQLGV